MRLAPPLLALAVLLAAPALAQSAHEVRLETVSDWRPVFGAVESVKRAPARVRLAGTLAELNVSEGDAVEEGQILARVEDEKLALEIAAVEAGLRALDAEAEQAEIDLERARELRARGAIPQASLDQARTAREVIEQTRAARRAERAVLRARQAEGRVQAPEAGRVLAVPAVQGMNVQPGETVAEIATDHFLLRARLPERHARFLGKGDPVRIAERGALSGGGGSREGRIVKVYPELEAGQVVVDVEAPGLGDFFVGERVRLEVATGRREAILAPPRYLDLRHGVTFARLAEGGEVVVQPGVRLARGVEILAGLKPGDRLLPYREAAE
jgi:RND family efflux transporter MFP subunit